ncbi:hypothetical protein C2G38_2176823, partial [Gigaspora rosea]
DIGTTDYEVSTITRHRSLSGIACYERPKDGVQQFALNNLITSIDSSETVASDTQLSLPANTLPATNLYQGFKSARQIFQGNELCVEHAFYFTKTKIPSTNITINKPVRSSPKVLESTLQLTDPPTLSIPEALAPTMQIASHPSLSSPETLKQKPLANSNLRRPLQPVSNNYVETQELNEIIEIQESQKEFFQRNLFTNSNITFHIHNHYYKS